MTTAASRSADRQHNTHRYSLAYNSQLCICSAYCLSTAAPNGSRASSLTAYEDIEHDRLADAEVNARQQCAYESP